MGSMLRLLSVEPLSRPEQLTVDLARELAVEFSAEVAAEVQRTETPSGIPNVSLESAASEGPPRPDEEDSGEFEKLRPGAIKELRERVGHSFNDGSVSKALLSERALRALSRAVPSVARSAGLSPAAISEGLMSTLAPGFVRRTNSEKAASKSTAGVHQEGLTQLVAEASRRYQSETPLRHLSTAMVCLLGLVLMGLTVVGAGWVLASPAEAVGQRLLGGVVAAICLTLSAGLLLLVIEVIGRFERDTRSRVYTWTVLLLENPDQIDVWTNLNPRFWDDWRVRCLMRKALRNKARVSIWARNPDEFTSELARDWAEYLVEKLKDIGFDYDKSFSLSLVRDEQAGDCPDFVITRPSKNFLYKALAKRLWLLEAPDRWWERPPKAWIRGPKEHIYTVNPLLVMIAKYRLGKFPAALSYRVLTMRLAGMSRTLRGGRSSENIATERE